MCVSRFFLLLVLLPMQMPAAASAAPQKSATANEPAASESSPLTSVTVTGSARFRSEEIAGATGLRVGASVSRDDLQAAADRLAQLGLFSSVNYRYISGETGVQVEYQVTDAPGLPVWFDNFPGFTDADLIAKIKAAVPLFDGTAPAHGSILDQIAMALENALAARGEYASVSHTLKMAPGGDRQIQEFRAEGATPNVARVDFSDALAQSDRGIQQRLADLVGKPYSRSAVELFEFEQVRPAYLSRGFLHVQFGTPEAKLAEASGNSDSHVGGVIVVAPIIPGAVYAWGGAVWAGNSAVYSLDLSALVPLKTGDPANGMKIESIWESVREIYEQRGYLDVDVKAKPVFDEGAKRIFYGVTITEGLQYHMGELVLTGLSLEGERRIRAAWSIPAGAVFDESAYEEFLSRGIKRAFMGMPFTYEKIGRFLQEDPKTGKVDVMLDFQ